MVYFYLMYEKTAKKHFFSKADIEHKRIEKDRLIFEIVGVPELYCKFFSKKKEWKKEVLIKELLKILQKSPAEQYWYNKDMALFLGEKEPNPPHILMEEMLFHYGVRENVVLIGKPNPLFESLFLHFMKKVNYLQVFCDNPEEYEEEAEFLYENYGTVIVFGKKLFRVSDKKPYLIIDMEEENKDFLESSVGHFAAGSIYMDMKSIPEKKCIIEQKRKDIHYLSPQTVVNKWCRLDTTAQNGYNTRVN